LFGKKKTLRSQISRPEHMELSVFQSFVRANAEWFHGVNPESGASLELAERQTGCSLPISLKWLLTEYGYSGPCGISSLTDAVSATVRCRSAISLREPYLILNDWGDAGVVCLDSQTGIVVWTHADELPRLSEGRPLHDADTFEDFPAWVVSRLEAEREEA
jgi:hypothetical protein